MTTDHPESTTIPSESETVSVSKEQNVPTKRTSQIDTDKVSAAMGRYMLQGWAMLNDGCPDCNTPLMRNREATSQICVNCELNPPVDPEEAENTAVSQAPETGTGVASTATDTASTAKLTEDSAPAAQVSQSLPPSPLAALSTPAPTSALPSLPAGASNTPIPGPGSLRPTPQNHRASVLDPMMEARRALRPVGARNLGGSSPAPPSTPPPPRASTPLPPPPLAAAKTVSGSLGPKAAIPLPPGPPPSSLPLSPPVPLGPQPVPRDMRRSPQSSIVISGNILPPPTPPPAPPASTSVTIATNVSAPLSAPPTLPPPPLVASAVNSEPAANAPEENELAQVAEASAEAAVKPAENEPVTEAAASTESTESVAETPQEDKNADALEPVQESAENQRQQEDQNQSKGQNMDGQAGEEDDDDERALESDDDFEDAEEEVFKPSEEELKEREAKREQSERASRLMGQKMLQGWAMLQDPCPNPSCHGVPLLANREKKEYCVVCENYFQREKDLDQGKYTIISKDGEGSNSSTTTTTTGTESSTSTPFTSGAILPPPPSSTTLPPPPQVASPATVSQRRNTLTSSTGKAISPSASPSMGRNQRELLGRVSASIVLPPAQSPMSPSLGMASQQILGKHMSEDLDKLASEDEEARKHLQIIRKVGEFSNKSLPPVPSAGPALPAAPLGSRPVSTYSSSSEYHPSEGERPEPPTRPLRHHHSQRMNQYGPVSQHHQHQQQSAGQSSDVSNNAPAPPPPAPLSPEVQALVTATHKTIATILVKLEAYRQALEVAESPKECQVLTNQIKGLMECLKACRETL
ncbi:hypothetical protein BGX28_007753 [Mortierella sp. GBA30]|nr:hypothetical protein BGX28_007753 [Mortierella sp. GBA30]